MMRKYIYAALAALLIAGTIFFVNLVRLPNVDLYYRCYAQLTQQRAPEDSVLQSVKTGALDPIQACVNVLESAVFSTGSTCPSGLSDTNACLPNTGNAVQKSVLKTLHSLHYSWFHDKEFPENDKGRFVDGARDTFDASTPALFLTRALFQQNGNAAEVFTLPDSLEAIRTDYNPATGAASLRVKSDYAYSPYKFAAIGELLGIRRTGAMHVTWSGGQNDLAGFREGGVLGTSAYILLTVNEVADPPSQFKSNGAEKMPRKFARAIYHDFFCRDLPVVRTDDITAFIDTSASAEFRKSASCTRCHASMDRLSAGIRGFQYQSINLGNPITGSTMIKKNPVSEPAEPEWPKSADANYHLRPPNGVLFYRKYDGNLVNQTFSGLTEMGQLISQQDDVYICWAQRYFRYFTGVDAEIRELAGEPPISLSSHDQRYRDLVIQLGLSFKNHKSPRRLIEDIMHLPEYADPGFGQ